MEENVGTSCSRYETGSKVLVTKRFSEIFEISKNIDVVYSDLSISTGQEASFSSAFEVQPKPHRTEENLRLDSFVFGGNMQTVKLEFCFIFR